MSKCTSRFDNATIGQVFTGDVEMLCPLQGPATNKGMPALQLERAARIEQIHWARFWGSLQPTITALFSLMLWQFVLRLPPSHGDTTTHLAITLMVPICAAVLWFNMPRFIRDNYRAARNILATYPALVIQLDVEIGMLQALDRARMYVQPRTAWTHASADSSSSRVE